MPKKLRKGGVRWGHLRELDRSAPIGTAEWRAAHPELRLRKLTAWRNLHRLRKHSTVSDHGGRRGSSPSSNMNLRDMIKLGQQFEKRRQKWSKQRPVWSLLRKS